MGAFLTNQGGHSQDSTLAVIAGSELSAAALSAVLQARAGREVHSVVSGAPALRDALIRMRPSVVVQDWTPNTERLDLGCTPHRLLLLDPADEPGVFLGAARSGARGYLARTASGTELEDAIRGLQATGEHLDPSLVSSLSDAGGGQAADGPAGGTTRALSRREREMLLGIARGQSSKELARQHAITPKTVSNHINRIYAKLRLRHRGELVMYVARQDWLVS